MRGKSTRIITTLAAVAGMSLALSAWAGPPRSITELAAQQHPGVRTAVGTHLSPQTYGIQSEIVKTILAQQFVPLDSATTWTFAFYSYGYQRWATAGGGAFDGSLELPAGAKLLGAEVDGCDSSTSNEVILVVFQSPKDNSGSAVVPIFLATGGPDTPGCGTFFVAASPQLTIDNDNFAYGVEVNTAASTGDTSFKAVRVYYQLQVSPPPATATFNDVPTTDPYFPFIEALSAAGITAGCGNGNYCPDEPVTRRQVAVFLAVALGLHWAP